MKDIKGMTEGAIFSGVFIVLLLLSLYTPIGFVSTYILPIPFIVYGYRHGLKNGISVMIINVFLAFFLGGFYSLFIAIIAVSLGLVMGVLYKKKTLLPAIVGGTLTVIIQFILGLFISRFLFGIDFVDQLKKLLLSSLDSAKILLDQIENKEQAEQMLQMYQEFFSAIGELLPFLFISSAIFIVWINHILAAKVLKRLGAGLPNLPPFREWTFPKSIVYYYLITILMIFFIPLEKYYGLKMILLNLYPLLQLILMIQGVSFIYLITYRRNWGKAVRVLAVVALIVPVFSQFINLLGIMDLSFDLRKKFRSRG